MWHKDRAQCQKTPQSRQDHGEESLLGPLKGTNLLPSLLWTQKSPGI